MTSVTGNTTKPKISTIFDGNIVKEVEGVEEAPPTPVAFQRYQVWKMLVIP